MYVIKRVGCLEADRNGLHSSGTTDYREIENKVNNTIPSVGKYRGTQPVKLSSQLTTLGLGISKRHNFHFDSSLFCDEDFCFGASAFQRRYEKTPD